MWLLRTDMKMKDTTQSVVLLVYKNQIFADEDEDFEYPDEDDMENEEAYEDAMMELL